MYTEYDYNMKSAYHQSKCQTISSFEHHALQDLTHNTHIVSKPVDKGGVIVIQNWSECPNERYNQLSYKSFYWLLDQDTKDTFRREIQGYNYVEDRYQNDVIDMTVNEYQTNTHCIHMGILPQLRRPIPSANGSPTEKI